MSRLIVPSRNTPPEPPKPSWFDKFMRDCVRSLRKEASVRRRTYLAGFESNSTVVRNYTVVGLMAGSTLLSSLFLGIASAMRLFADPYPTAATTESNIQSMLWQRLIGASLVGVISLVIIGMCVACALGWLDRWRDFEAEAEKTVPPLPYR